MGWKNWPYWLRGVVVGALFCLVYIPFTILSTYKNSSLRNDFIFVLVTASLSTVIYLLIGGLLGVFIGFFLNKRVSYKKRGFYGGGVLGLVFYFTMPLWGDSLEGTDIELFFDTSYAESPAGALFLLLFYVILIAILGFFIGWIIDKSKTRRIKFQNVKEK